MKGPKRTGEKDVAGLLRHQQGVRFLRRLLQMTGVWSASYVTNDPLAMAYNEGRRAVGMYVLQLVQLQAPEMMDELLGWAEARPLWSDKEALEDE